MKTPFAIFRRRVRNLPRQGFALVVALTAIVLITIIVLAFFSKALLNRQISFTSTNQIKTDMLARSAVDLVVGEVRQEIVDYSFAPTNGIYQAMSRSNLIPARSGVSSPDSTTGAYTIAKVATTNGKINPGPNGTTLGSSVALDTKSRNGRTSSRWFTSGPLLGTADLPTWIYQTRSGVAPASLTASDGANPKDTNFIVGRFSYTVYNTSGLLDANVSGYPATVSVTNSRGKNSLAYADLTTLGLTTNQVGHLVSWRNAATGTNATIFNEWATGTLIGNTAADKAAVEAANGGHIYTAKGDNAFFSRRDLLRFLQANGISNSVAGNLTHFSRATTAPSWGPTNVAGSSFSYGDDANKASSPNRFLPAVPAFNGTIQYYYDDGTSESYDVTSQDSLVSHRFSLAKLAWLGHDGPNDAAFDASINQNARELAIKTCFGLTWNNGKKRWDYNHGDANNILTLDQVRQQKRAPDFFELLKAGILSGSLGQQPGAVANDLGSSAPADKEGPMGRDFEFYSAEKDRHILQIGANIIDQADPDNYPTAIYQDKFTKYPEDDLYNSVFGVENLPMLHRIALLTCFLADHSPKPPSALPPGPMGIWIQPEIWNPHDKTSGTPAPTKLRMVTYGSCFAWNITDDPARAQLSPTMNFGNDPTTPNPAGIIYFKNPAPNSTTPPSFYDNPIALTGFEQATNRYDDPAETQDPNNRYPIGKTTSWDGDMNKCQFMAVWVGQVSRTPTDNLGFSLRLLPAPYLTFVLEYHDGVSWRPYFTTARIEEVLTQTWASGGSGTYGHARPRASAGHVDPRTDRFSSSGGMTDNGGTLPYCWLFQTTAYPKLGTDALHRDGESGIEYAWPRPNAGFTHDTSQSAGKYLLGDWSQNLPTSSFHYVDTDGVVRPGDSAQGDLTTGAGMMLFHGTSPTTVAGIGDSTSLSKFRASRRPIVLNRPFRAVGELGYVFRDVPFKTLDFWSDKSPDAGLLDIFSVKDEPGVTAGLVNINTAPPTVVQALLKGAAKMEIDSNLNIGTDVQAGAGGYTQNDEATTLSQSIASSLTSNGPLSNRSELATALGDAFQTGFTANSASAITKIANKGNKTFAESPARSLSSTMNSSTWNLLIDVVAQSGAFPPNATNLTDSFIVQGERRYWLHVAIDRLTGKVVDQQLEAVYE